MSQLTRLAILRLCVAAAVAIAFVAFGTPPSDSAAPVELRPLWSLRAAARVELTIPLPEAIAFAHELDEATAHVEDLFRRRFERRPDVVLFASRASFAKGTSDLFGYEPGTAAAVASAYGGIFDRPTSTIALNSAALSGTRLRAALEHELVHQMVREATRAAAVPVWFEEGIATLVGRERLPAQELWLDEEALVAHAIAASGRASFADLATVAGWHETYERVGSGLYAYAGEAVGMMESRVGWIGLLDLLDHVAGGRALADAYAAHAGETLRALEERLAARGEARIIVRRGPTGADLRWTLFAGLPNVETAVTITGGAAYTLSFTVVTDALGLYRGSFGSTAAPGLYLVRAAGLEAVLATER